jgi:hypothetical protein
MAGRKKRDRVENLVSQLIKNELEAQLAKMVRKAQRRATREAGKLNDTLRLEYRKDEGFVDAEYREIFDKEKKEGASG